MMETKYHHERSPLFETCIFVAVFHGCAGHFPDFHNNIRVISKESSLKAPSNICGCSAVCIKSAPVALIVVF